MRKLFLLFLLMFVFLISGCTQKQYVCFDGSVVTDPVLCPAQPEEREDEVVVEAPVQEEMSDPQSITQPSSEVASSLSITDADKTILDEKLDKDPVVMASTVMKKGIHVGQSYVFPLGFKNNKNDKREYQVTYIGLDGKTKSNSNAGNDETIVSWLSKTPQQNFFTLDKNERFYIPVIVNIGAAINKDGKKTVSGTYKFMVKIGQRQQGQQLYDELGSIIFYVRVD
ncbi:hypothetical protein HYY69_08560 [Candidatus Woesearchaeota archaeon]|nr:hypothetical protein [Candidatus Woesearchaeota archaeon]